jgi:hypothetical protein
MRTARSFLTASVIPVIDGKPVYESGTVPEGLRTLKQLDEEGSKYAPDQKPAAWLRYILGGSAPRLVSLRRGQSRPLAIAPLYNLADSLPKRSCSPKQLSVLEAARDQRRICDHCGATRHTNPTRVEWPSSP